MKLLYFSITFILGIQFIGAQTYEIGPVVGHTSFVGDVGATQVINTDQLLEVDKLSYGILFRWNRSERHSLRFSATKFRTFVNDADSDIPERQGRGLNFNSDINELAIGLEYTFWEWDLHSIKRPQIVPYLSTGLAYYFTDHHARAGNELIESGDLNGLAIPLTFGVKSTIGRRFVISAEFSARYTFSDNFDGSSPTEIDSNTAFPEFGNPNSNDWYIFAGFSLTYTFGRKPCYNCTF
jgi:hypothetical protein